MAKAFMASGRPAFEAVSNFTVRALVILYVCILKRAEVVTVVCTAFEVASWITGLHDHFPLESLPPVHFLLVQEHLEVIFGLECVLAVGFWASDWELALIDLSFGVFSEAFRVEKVLAAGDAVDGSLLVVFVK